MTQNPGVGVVIKVRQDEDDPVPLALVLTQFTIVNDSETKIHRLVEEIAALEENHTWSLSLLRGARSI